jgi:hypothetical protein
MCKRITGIDICREFQRKSSNLFCKINKAVRQLMTGVREEDIWRVYDTNDIHLPTCNMRINQFMIILSRNGL